MNDAVSMRELQGIRALTHDVRDQRGRQGKQLYARGARLKQVGERAMRDIGHDEEVNAILLAIFVEREDVRMIESGDRAGFLSELPNGLRLRVDARRRQGR